MKHVLSFDGPAVGLTKPYKYQVMHLETLGKVQIWFQEPGCKWAIGHSKEIPEDWDADAVASTMLDFILGDLTSAEYNELLPR